MRRSFDWFLRGCSNIYALNSLDLILMIDINQQSVNLINRSLRNEIHIWEITDLYHGIGYSDDARWSVPWRRARRAASPIAIHRPTRPSARSTSDYAPLPSCSAVPGGSGSSRHCYCTRHRRCCCFPRRRRRRRRLLLRHCCTGDDRPSGAPTLAPITSV